jgi:hypothetical protein
MSPDEFLALASPFAAAWFLVWLTHVSEGSSVTMPSGEDGQHSYRGRKKHRKTVYHYGEEMEKQPQPEITIMWNVSNFFNRLHDRIA